MIDKEYIKKALLIQFDKWYEQMCKDEHSSCNTLGPSANIVYYIENSYDIFNDAMWFIMNNCCFPDTHIDHSNDRNKVQGTSNIMEYIILKHIAECDKRPKNVIKNNNSDIPWRHYEK